MRTISTSSFIISIIALTLGQPGFSNKDNPKIKPIPEDPQFIIVDNESNRELGSAYFPKTSSSLPVDRKQIVLCNIDGSSQIETTRGVRQNNFISFKMRQTDTSSDVSASVDAEATAKMGLAEAVLSHKMKSTTKTNSITFDLLVVFSPMQDTINREQTKFLQLRDLYPMNGSFTYYLEFQKHGRSTTTCRKNFKPGGAHSREILSMCGTSVIQSRYYGVTLTRSITFNFKSQSAKTEFQSKFSGDLSKFTELEKAKISAELKTALENSDISVNVASESLNFNELTKYLSDNGYSELIEEYKNRNKHLLAAASKGNAIKVIDAAFNLVQILDEMEQQLSSIDLSSETVAEIFPIIAVRPGSHSQCVANEYQSMATNLGWPLNLAWNNISGNNTWTEKKEKEKKMK